jgi:hypothetical protein
MRLLKRQTDEDSAVVEDDDGSREHIAERPTTEELPRTEETERVAEPDGRSGKWYRRTVTVPMTVPERSVTTRRTMRIPSRRLEQTSAGPVWNPASILAIAAGGALAVVGVVALMRAGINDTWFQPQVEVLDADHTALLGLIEVGAGVLVLLLGLIGSRVLIAMAGIAGSLVATAAAVAPEDVARELAIESWWAWTLAGVAVLLTLVALQPAKARQTTLVDVT